MKCFYQKAIVMYAGLAQLVEQLICNQQVGGSNPSSSSSGVIIRPQKFCGRAGVFH